MSETYPWVEYQDVSEFLETLIDYKVHKYRLAQQKKLLGPKPRRVKRDDEKRQHKTAVYVMEPNHKWQMDLINPPLGNRQRLLTP